MKHLNKKGLTLVEGLLALTILVVVLTTAVIVYLNYVKPAAERSRKTSIFNAVLSEAEKYAGAHLNSAYPSADTMAQLLGVDNIQDAGVVSYECGGGGGGNGGGATLTIQIAFSTEKVAKGIVPEWNAEIAQGYSSFQQGGGNNGGGEGACTANGNIVSCAIPVPACEQGNGG